MAEGEEMKNFKVVIKTDRKNCPMRFFIGYKRITIKCKANDFKPCTEKNCPFKEEKK